MSSPTPTPSRGFHFTKWYADCTAPDGRVLIAYWASLAWRSVALTWQQVTVFEPGDTRTMHASLAGGPPPVADHARVAWTSPALGGTLVAESQAPAFATRLYDSPRGAVDWHVVAPAAHVHARFRGGDAVSGPGYVECMTMTVPPWALPIRELRWGRWIGGVAPRERSVVWVDWRGRAPITHVYVDGVRTADGRVDDTEVAGGGMQVEFGARRTLHTRAFRELASAIPPLTSLVPDSLLALRQTTWRTDAANGTCIHEVVVFA